jgi:CubicO group peptidase (beta-lactamase class C family)
MIFLLIAPWLAQQQSAAGAVAGVGVAEAYYKPLIERGTVTAAAFAEVSHGGEAVESAVFGRAGRDSLWRGASTSKAFTAIAVMRLIQQGRLDPDAEVNRYLKRFRLTRPATLRHLLTHTSGLDDPFAGSCFLAGVPAAFSPPQQLYEPGEVKLYSNAGYGVIGAVIEDVTGQRFEDFMRTAVFEPFGMTASTFQQPLPEADARRVVPSLERTVFGTLRPAPILYHRSTAAGGLTTSLADLIRFAQFVQKGGYAELQGALRNQGEEGSGFGFGTNRGEKYWYAGGDLGGYHTVILWFPERDRALVTMAASASSLATWNLVPKVMESWFGLEKKPDPLPAQQPPASHSQAREFAARVAGLYRPVRYPHHDLAKTFVITMDQAVRDNGDGSIQQAGERWIASEPLRFRTATGDGRSLTFRQDSAGRIRFLNRDTERIGWYESGRAAVGFYAGFVVLSAIVLWRVMRRERWLRLVALAILLHSVGWLAAMLIADPQRLILGLPWYLEGALWFGWSVPFLWVCLAVAVLQGAIRNSWTRSGALWRVVTAGLLGLYVPFCLYWQTLPTLQ